MRVLVGQDIGLQSARAAGERVSQRRRLGSLEHGIAAVQPGAIEGLKTRRGECVDGLIEPLFRVSLVPSASTEVPAQLVDGRRAQRGRDVLVKGGLVERDGASLVWGNDKPDRPRRQ